MSAVSSPPIALLIFNRPEYTAKTFSAIRRAQPKFLFIIADGPRKSVESDVYNCMLARSIVENVDWECSVRRIYSDKNLGLRARVISGLDMVFSEVDRAIVLEDDCVPAPEFFAFCEAMLDKYNDVADIGAITGSNFQKSKKRGDASYYFSKFNHCWGWATWSRAWSAFDKDISFIEDDISFANAGDFLSDPVEKKYWIEIFTKVREGRINSWAYAWTASLWNRRMLTITPNVNLIENVGTGEEATNTKTIRLRVSQDTSESLGEIIYAKEIVRNIEADVFTFNHHYGGKYYRFPLKLLVPLRRALYKVVSSLR